MKYECNLPKIRCVNREKLLLGLCRGKKVLHLGCADSPLLEEGLSVQELLHNKLTNVTRELWGVDIDQKSITHLQQLGIRNLLYADAEHLDSIEELKQRRFDVIVAGELIEHLDNPGLFLKSCKQFLHHNGILVLTTPNAFRLINFFSIFFSKEIIHPDHNFWFSPTSLMTILTKHGYSVCGQYIDDTRLGVSLERGVSSYQVIKRTVYDFFNRCIQRFVIRLLPYFGNGLIFIVQRKMRR